MTERPAEQVPLPGGDFRLFVTRLSFQGMMSLGLLENPITHSKQVNLESARMILDDLLMLRELTKGNLDGDEQAHIDKVCKDLEFAYVKLEKS